METLSIKSQLAYQVIAGIKDIENRSWQTSYRGKIQIHASGNYQYHELIISLLPAKMQKDLKSGVYIKNHELIKDEQIPVYIMNIYKFYYDVLLPFYKCETINEFYKKLPCFKTPFFKTQAIIGTVDIVDIIKDSNSIFADKNQYHWILKNPVLYTNPILPVKGKLRIWDY